MRSKKSKLEKDLQKEINTLTEVSYEDVENIEEGFQELIKSDPKYSLAIDPLNQYDFSDKEKDFISYMTQYKNVQFVSTVLMNIPLQEGVAIYKSYKVQNEIKRISIALYVRRFATKMANINQLGGYLTSGLMDDNIPVADRWNAKEKLTATKLLINLNLLKQKGLEEPKVLEVVDIQKDLEKLNPNEIKQLIEYNDEGNLEKEKYIELINSDNCLSMEELKDLRMMTVEELKELYTEISGESIPEEDNEDEED